MKLNDPEMTRRINALRKTDNVTNWFYLAREYLFLGSVIGLTLAFYHYRGAWGLSWAWNIPVTLAAILLVGAGQHRLSTLGHEASHYSLFRNRLLNELASDWLCFFHLWSITHNFRLQHMAHHQFPNDPHRDPDVSQMKASGHRYQFPMQPRQFVWECVIKQLLWLPSLIRYMTIRAKYSSAALGDGPYQVKRKPSKLLMAGGALYLAALAGGLTLLVRSGDSRLLALFPAGMLAVMLTYFSLVPDRWYPLNAVKPDIPPRYYTLGRMTYMTLVFSGLAWLSHLTDRPWGLYYLVLWLLPLMTTYGFFMLMRQLVQHGNGGQQRLTNTRIFHVGSLIRFSVFPLGMDYHLPHHLFPMVPHYRLKQLHELLMEAEDYQREAPMIEGYFFHERPPVHRTVLEMMAGPAPGTK